MGIFSRKTIITVASVVYPMGEDPDRIPDVVKSSVIAASLKGMPVARSIRDSIFEGAGVKISQAYSYAKSQYYAGMPTGFPKEHGSGPVINTLCKEYLQSIFPSDTIVLQTTATTFSDDYQTKMKELVAAEFNYDFFIDHTLSATGAVQANASLIVHGSFRDFVNHETELGYKLEFTNPDASIVTIDKWYPLTQFAGYEIIIKRVIMEYSRNGGRSVQESYEKGGSSARLNIYLRDLDYPVSGTFPALVLKRDNIYLNDDRFGGAPWKTSQSYLTTKQYCKRLGMNIDTLLGMVKDNASEGDIDYCFLQPGVRLNSPNQAVMKYLFNYFDRLRMVYPDNKPAWDKWVADTSHGNVSFNLANGAPAQSIHFFDPDNPTSSLDMEIAWRYMTYTEKTGTVAGYTRTVGPQTEAIAKYSSGQGGTLSERYDTTMFYINKQLTPTTYAEIAICGLRHENYIYKGHSVQSGVWASINAPDSDDGTGFILPLDYPIYVTLSPRERLQLAQESLHMVFNCYVARKQKWYETSIFKVVLIIIAVVLIIISFGSATPYVTATYSGISAALATLGLNATLTAALAALITSFVLVAVAVTIKYLSTEAGKWATEHWGPEWGAVVQIVAVIGLTWGLGTLGVGPGFSLSPANLTDSVLLIGNQVLSMMSAYTEYTYVALKNEVKTWEDYVGKPDDPLENVNNLMKEMFPELTDIQQAAILPKPETLDEFLGRTLTSGNELLSRLTLPIYNMADLTLTPRL